MTPLMRAASLLNLFLFPAAVMVIRGIVAIARLSTYAFAGKGRPTPWRIVIVLAGVLLRFFVESFRSPKGHCVACHLSLLTSSDAPLPANNHTSSNQVSS